MCVTRRLRRVSSTSGACAPRSTTTSTPAAPVERSSCASRTPTARGSSPRPCRTSTTYSRGWASIGTRGRTTAARTGRTSSLKGSPPTRGMRTSSWGKGMHTGASAPRSGWKHCARSRRAPAPPIRRSRATTVIAEIFRTLSGRPRSSQARRRSSAWRSRWRDRRATRISCSVISPSRTRPSARIPCSSRAMDSRPTTWRMSWTITSWRSPTSCAARSGCPPCPCTSSSTARWGGRRRPTAISPWSWARTVTSCPSVSARPASAISARRGTCRMPF